jgi:hypothetical protein
MNQEKAREFFSGYYEGTLENGLRQTLEQRLRTDGQLQAEYKAFERTMDQLDLLKFEEIEVPSYLSDRIATRIEQAQANEKRKNPLMLWVPRFAGGLAAAALVFGVVNIFVASHGPATSGIGISGGPAVTAPPVTQNWPSETISVSPAGRTVDIHYLSFTARSVVVLDDANRSTTYKVAANQPLKVSLANPNPGAALFEVKVSDNGPDEFIAVPGRNPEIPAADNGTVSDFVKVLADKYNVPLILRAQDPGKTISWNLDANNAQSAAQKSLEGENFDVSLTETKVVTISSK